MTEQEEYQEYLDQLEYQKYLKSQGQLSGTDTVKKQVANTPSSAWNYAKALTMPLHSPVQFSQGMGNLIMGGVEKLIPGQQSHEIYADNLVQNYKDAYGTWDRTKNTAMNDPFRFASDLSLTGALTTLPLKGTQFGNALNKTSIAVEPVNIAANAVKTGIKAITPKNKPAEMYESAAKFSTTIPKKKRDAMVQTALDEGIPPSGKGVAKIESIIDEIDGKIDTLIAEATNNGGVVQADRVFENLPELRKELGSATQSDPMGNLAKIDDVEAKISEGQFINNKSYYTVEELQQLKRNLYKDANFDVKQSKADPAVNQARKNIANKAKTLIEEQIPDIADLNRRYGKMIDLQEPITRSANRIDNRNLLSINQPLNTGVGYGVADMPGAIAASIATALGNPKVKPQIAIWLNKLNKQGLLDLWLDNKGLPYTVRQGLLQVDRSNDQTSTP